MKKIINKFLYSLILVTILFNFCGGLISNAIELNNANIVSIGTAEHHLKFFKEEINGYSYVTCDIVGYYYNNNFYPAYCMNKDLKGVSSEHNYSVNINEIIKRDDVWRVVKNGYPYKNYEDMGVANDFDAFVVTKMAVYCITGQSNLSDFYAEPDDAEAVNMLDALTNLVNIGVNGEESKTEGNFEISKIDGFTEEGDCYYQKYEISSGIEMKDIQIDVSDNLPKGSYISKIDDMHFKLYIPKSSLNSNINGDVIISGKCKIYPLFYGEAEDPANQNYLLTYDTFGEISSKCNVEFKTNTGKIKIKKTDSETAKSLEGVEFKLFNQEGVEIATKTTNSNGEIEFTDLFQGKYILKEVKTNDNYILNSNGKEVIVEYNKTNNQNITNNHKKADLKIYKVDKDNNKITLGNVEFDLYSEEFQKVVGTYYTNADGEIEIKNLRVGNYKLIEKKTGKWYNLADSKEIEVKWEEKNENIVENELKKGGIKVIKVDKDNNEIKLKDVKFNVLDLNGNVLETIITDEKGEAYTSRYPIRDYEKLIIKEVETNKAYKLNDTPQTVTLKENEIVEVKFENEVKKGKIKVIKVDKDNHEVKLKGVKFDVLNSKGRIVEKLVTDENGEAETSRLPISEEYTLRETETLKNYKLSDKDMKIKLEEDEIKNIIFENEEIKNRFKIIKVDKDNKEIKLEGVEFEVFDENNKLLEKLVTDKNGEAISKFYPVYNRTYTIHELNSIPGYVKLDDYTSFRLNKDKIIEIIVENEKIPEKPEEEEEKEEEEIIENPTPEPEVKVLPRTGY